MSVEMAMATILTMMQHEASRQSKSMAAEKIFCADFIYLRFKTYDADWCREAQTQKVSAANSVA